MMKFACFERTVEAIYAYVVPKPRDQCSKSEQLVVTFAAGYIAGVFCAIVSHPADTLVSYMNKVQGATLGSGVKDLGFKGLWGGLGPRIIMIGTLTALQWFIYDAVKVGNYCHISKIRFHAKMQSSFDAMRVVDAKCPGATASAATTAPTDAREPEEEAGPGPRIGRLESDQISGLYSSPPKIIIPISSNLLHLHLRPKAESTAHIQLIHANLCLIRNINWRFVLQLNQNNMMTVELKCKYYTINSATAYKI